MLIISEFEYCGKKIKLLKLCLHISMINNEIVWYIVDEESFIIKTCYIKFMIKMCFIQNCSMKEKAKLSIMLLITKLGVWNKIKAFFLIFNLIHENNILCFHS